ncbi:MAG: hypothetical protein U1F43_19500 [Myxococcota bacterium]
MRPWLVVVALVGVAGAVALALWVGAPPEAVLAPATPAAPVAPPDALGGRPASAAAIGETRGPRLLVPRAATAPTLDGDLSDAAWLAGPARTGALTATAGHPPYGDARLLWKDDVLYVALYAADEDIRAPRTGADEPLWLDDHFHLEVDGRGFDRSIDVSPRAVLTDGRRPEGIAGPLDYRWQSGARLEVELDGTVDSGGDEADEEWVVEMALPLAALDLAAEPGASTTLEVRRCDTPPGQAHICASWRGSIELAP